MCGIAGIGWADPHRPVPAGLIERMTSIVHHRGPDGHGFHRGPGIGLGIRRLAIIDLATGDQPIFNEDGTVAVVCNGEIYNHLELRAELEAAGHRFRTRSDVEVIVHLYEVDGLEAVRRLRGMFGFALWDARRRRLWLVRDRVGIKPLHYATTPDGCYFGSELKSILATGAIPSDLDAHALDELLAYGFVPEPRTLFRRIRRVPPAHWLVYEGGVAVTHEYWRLGARAEGAASELCAAAWAERLRAKLEETVRLHLRSDVPIGAWLSGGVDSSGIASLSQRLLDRPLQTFTLAFEARAYDETHGQRTLDQVPGHDLPNERIVCDRAAFEAFPKTLWHAETPSANTAEIPRMLLSEATARRVKVVLTGEGSDEVFGGYPWFLADRLLRPLGGLPLAVRRALLLGPIVRAWRPWGARILLGPRAMGCSRYSRMVGPLGAEERHHLLSAELRTYLAEEPDGGGWVPPDVTGWEPFAQLQRYEFGLRLPGYGILTLDRASMAFGVEARVPFLDHELIELCAEIPAALKLRGLCTKYILRRALEGLLPPDILWRRKRGLRAPVVEWLRGPLPDFADELLSPRVLRATGYFDPGAVRTLLARHRAGRGNRAGLLMGVLGIQLWHELFRRPGPNLAAMAPA